MISPFTKPGTLVKYIDPDETAAPSLPPGQDYGTISRIEIIDGLNCERMCGIRPSAFLCEDDQGPFCLCELQVLELPRSITQYLDDVKSPITEREHV